MFEAQIERLRACPPRVVMPEGEDPRIAGTAVRLAREGVMRPTLVGEADAVREAVTRAGGREEDVEVVDPAALPDAEGLAREMVRMRLGRATPEECRELVRRPNYLATMLLATRRADLLVGGAVYTTFDIALPALQLVRAAPGRHLVSSCYLFTKGEGEPLYVMGDPAINISYEDQRDMWGDVVVSAPAQLAEVAVSFAEVLDALGVEPRVAMLSYSTRGSGRGPEVDLVRQATEAARAMAPDLAIDGELQFDAAFSPAVAARKAPGSPVAGRANAFVFPEINSANTACKIIEHLAGYRLFGPILLGLAAPVSDLSRGCTAEEAYLTAIVAASLALGR